MTGRGWKGGEERTSGGEGRMRQKGKGGQEMGREGEQKVKEHLGCWGWIWIDAPDAVRAQLPSNHSDTHHTDCLPHNGKHDGYRRMDASVV